MLFRNIATGLAGRHVSRSFGGGMLGTAAAAALPFIAKRGLGPLGAALTAGWVAKQGLEWYRRRRAGLPRPRRPRDGPARLGH